MKKTVLFLLMLLFFQACTKKEDPVAPEVAAYGTISGKISDASTGIPVAIVNIKTSPSTSSVSSDSVGSYKFSNIPPGDYIITASKTGYDSTSIKISVIAGSNTTGDIFMMKTDSSKLLTTGIISGRVLNVQTNLPIANVLISTSPFSSNVTTAADGTFLIKNVSPGQVTVLASKTGFDSVSTKITVVKAQTSLTTIMMAPKDTSIYGVIQGIITDGLTGQPLTGAAVYTEPSTSSVVTDNTGKYIINDVLAGKYKVTVTKNGYTSASVSITVIAGKSTQANMEVLSPTGRIKGQVTDAETGSPLAGVNIKTNPGTSTVTTNANGEYEIPQVSAGTFTLTAEKTGYVSATASVAVKAGTITTADIVMKRTP